MAINVSPDVYNIAPGESGNISVSMLGFLDTGELFVGVPTIVEQGGPLFTLTDKKVNTTTIVIKGKSHLPGQAIQFNATAGAVVANTTYFILITASTNSTPAQTRKSNVRLVGATA